MSIPSQAVMRAIRVSKFGSSKALQLVTNAPRPDISANQVLVRVHCSGVNPVDTYVRSGEYAKLPDLPYIPGKDGAGVVHAVGEGVTKHKVGDRVFCTQNVQSGTLAEFTAMNENNVFPLHERLSFGEGCAVAIPYFTAYRALYLKGGAAAGRRVLVHGASGAVGQATVQMATAGGMVVVGTAGTKEGMQLVEKCGAVRVYNHRTTVICAGKDEEPFDLVVEMRSDVNLGHDLELLAPRGTVVVVGCRGDVTINPRFMMGPETSIVGCSLFSASQEEWEQGAQAVLRGIEEGWVKPRVSREYDLEQVRQAHDDIMNENITINGKLVVNVV